MFDNHMYNLFMQIVEEHQSLWRMRGLYREDAVDCDKCKDFWDELADRKEKTIEELEELIKSHLE